MLETGRRNEKGRRCIAERSSEKVIVRRRSPGPPRSSESRLAGANTQRAIVGGHKVLPAHRGIRERHPGEIFIDMHKEGRASRAMMNKLRHRPSRWACKYGVPLESSSTPSPSRKVRTRPAWCRATRRSKNATLHSRLRVTGKLAVVLPRPDRSRPCGTPGADVRHIGRGEEEGKRNFREMPGAAGFGRRRRGEKRADRKGDIRGPPPPRGHRVQRGGEGGTDACRPGAMPRPRSRSRLAANQGREGTPHHHHPRHQRGGQRTTQDAGLRGRGLRRMRQLHAGQERDLHEVQYVWRDVGMQLGVELAELVTAFLLLATAAVGTRCHQKKNTEVWIRCGQPVTNVEFLHTS